MISEAGDKGAKLLLLDRIVLSCYPTFCSKKASFYPERKTSELMHLKPSYKLAINTEVC